MESEGHPVQDTHVVNDGILFDGSWERSGRTLNGAAILALLGIGVLYFNVQAIFGTILYVANSISSPPADPSQTFIDSLTAYVEMHKHVLQALLVVTQFLCLLVPTLNLIRRWHTSEVRRYIRLKGCSILHIVLAILCTLMIMPAEIWITNLIGQSLHIPKEFSKITEAFLTPHSVPEFLWLVFAIGVTPAICEEILFRGYIQRTFERTVGVKSVLIVGVLFGLYHFRPLGLVTLSMLGVLLGYFFYRSKSLLPNMAAHFTNNAVLIWLLFVYPGSGSFDSGLSKQLPFAFVLGTFVAGMGTLALYHIVTQKNFIANDHQQLTV